MIMKEKIELFAATAAFAVFWMYCILHLFRFI